MLYVEKRDKNTGKEVNFYYFFFLNFNIYFSSKNRNRIDECGVYVCVQVKCLSLIEKNACTSVANRYHQTRLFVKYMNVYTIHSKNKNENK